VDILKGIQNGLVALRYSSTVADPDFLDCMVVVNDTVHLEGRFAESHVAVSPTSSITVSNGGTGRYENP
jgi:hypothetical protein